MELSGGKTLKKKTAGSILKKILCKNLHITDILWLYTLIALFAKSIVLLGLTLDQMHASILYKEALNIASQYIAFYVGAVIVPLSLAFLFKKKARLWYLISINLFISILFCADLWYFRGFNTMPTFHVLKETPNLNNLSGSIVGMMRKVDITFLCDFIILIPLAFITRKAYRNVQRSMITFFITFVIAVGFILYIPISLYVSDQDVENSIIYMYDSTITSQRLSPLGYQLYSVYTFFNEGKAIKLTDDERNQISQWYEQKKENLPDNKYKGMFAGKNLLVIQVESLEKFVIQQKVDGQELTPYLNKLIKNSIYFSNIHEQVHEGNTIDAEFTSNTSIYPLKQGSTSFLYPYNNFNSLPKIMKKNGYYTSDIQPDEGSFWNWMVLMKSLGFDKCIDNTSFKTDEAFGMGISDESYLKQLEPMIVKQKQPFYTFTITMSNHTPYKLPSWLRELKLPSELDDTYLGGYFQSVRYTDKYLGIFLDNLQKDGILDNTVVVIYGDHEGIHKYFPDSLKDINLPGDWWKDNNKGTPFLIYAPGLKGEEIKTAGGEVDILPTICYIMGIDENDYINTAMGRNLLNTGKNFAVLQGGKYVGDNSDSKQVEHDIKGPDIADMIIRSNYFNAN
jgi:Phosphoglycerol transferase and related proteins, alkaline phosphatase superfamily